MKIFITGGTGLIGRAFIDHIYKNQSNVDVTVLTRNAHEAGKSMPKSVAIISNLSEVNFSNVDVILNLAGEPIVSKRWSESQKKVLIQSRCILTDQIVNKINKECDERKPVRFLSGSAVGIYGRQGNSIITEHFKNHFPEFSHKLCQQWEDTAKQAKAANVAYLRTGIVLSNNGGALDKMLLPFKLGLGGKISSGQQYMPWIHIDDMVNAIQFLIEHPVLTGPFNMTAPKPVTNKTFSEALAKTLKRPCLFPVPEFVLRLMMGEMADLVLYGQNAIPEKLIEADFPFKYEKLEPALQDILKD